MVLYYSHIRGMVSWLEAHSAVFKWGHHILPYEGPDTRLHLSLQGDKALVS